MTRVAWCRVVSCGVAWCRVVPGSAGQRRDARVDVGGGVGVGVVRLGSAGRLWRRALARVPIGRAGGGVGEHGGAVPQPTGDVRVLLAAVLRRRQRLHRPLPRDALRGSAGRGAGVQRPGRGFRRDRSSPEVLRHSAGRGQAPRLRLRRAKPLLVPDVRRRPARLGHRRAGRRRRRQQQWQRPQQCQRRLHLDPQALRHRLQRQPHRRGQPHRREQGQAGSRRRHSLHLRGQLEEERHSLRG